MLDACNNRISKMKAKNNGPDIPFPIAMFALLFLGSYISWLWVQPRLIKLITNYKKNPMKNLLLSVLSAILLLSILYGSIAFFFTSFNPICWNYHGRFVFSFFGAVICFIVVIIHSFKRNTNEV